MLIVGIAVAGAIGAPARFLLDDWIQDRTGRREPFGILVVNISGSLVLGFITGLALYHALPATPKTVLGTGFCGAYTTFSTFAFDTVRMAEEGERARRRPEPARERRPARPRGRGRARRGRALSARLRVRHFGNIRPMSDDNKPVLMPTDVSTRVGFFDRFAGRASQIAGRAAFFAFCVLLIRLVGADVSSCCLASTPGS